MPKLSETLSSPRALDVCQSCGARPNNARAPTVLFRWLEHDEHDHPTAVVVVLCRGCGERLIEPHPRLYRWMDSHEPLPGSMPLCSGCRFLDGLRCGNPLAKSNGGAGIVLKFPQPTMAMVDGVRNGRRTGWRQAFYSGPVSSCSGREET